MESMGCRRAPVNPRLKLCDAKGQSTVEFALVTAAFLIVFVGLGIMWKSFSQGVVIDHAVAAAPYHVSGGSDAVVADVFAA